MRFAFILPIILLVIGGLIFVLIRFRKKINIGVILGIAFIGLVGLIGSFIYGKPVPSKAPATTAAPQKNYVQWDPVAEEYQKFTFENMNELCYFTKDGGITYCSYTSDGNDIVFSDRTRWEYDSYEDCYWQYFEENGQIYKSKIFAVEDKDWNDNHLFYQYRTDNGTASVGSAPVSGSYALEISQANTAISQGNYEEAYLILLAIAEDSEEAKQLLSKFAFVPLEDTSIYLDVPNTTVYTYDDKGYLTSMYYNEPAYSRTTYTHDNQGRILTEHIEYENVEYGGIETRDYIYSYDSSGRLIKKSENNINVYINYTYDNHGNLIGETTENAYGIVNEIAYTYDGNGNLLLETNAYGSGDVYTDAYTYDANGNCLTYTETTPYNHNQYTYTYDGKGNILKEKNYDGEITLYTYYHYDQDGRLIKKEAEFSAYQNGLLSVKTRTCTYTYNSEGLLHIETETIDSLSGTMTYTYDKFGNVVSYVSDSSYLTHNTTVSYTYQLFYYPNGVPEQIQEIVDTLPPY